MLNKSLTYIIYKTVHIYSNDVLYLTYMYINSLTELIQETVYLILFKSSKKVILSDEIKTKKANY